MSSSPSLVATFKEKFRPKYGKSVASNSRYIKENVYFNGVALKESLLHDNECPETLQMPNRRLQQFTRDDKTIHTNPKKYSEFENGCFVYQNPTSYCNDNDVVHKFTDMSLITEVGIDSNYSQRSFDNKTFRLVKTFNRK